MNRITIHKERRADGRAPWSVNRTVNGRRTRTYHPTRAAAEAEARGRTAYTGIGTLRDPQRG